jgi:predicted nucleic acid-binding protein
VVREPESAALWRWARRRELVSSDLLRCELVRVARRAGSPALRRARALLEAVALFPVGTHVFERAGLLDPADLRSLDALHLAAALDLGDDLEGIVAYDVRLAEAASHHGIEVVAPR